MITQPLKTRSDNFIPPAYHLNTIPYDYIAPDGTMWSIKSIGHNTVHLWTVNAWGAFHYKAVNIYEFKATWKEYHR